MGGSLWTPSEVGGGERAPQKLGGDFPPLEVGGGERAPPKVCDGSFRAQKRAREIVISSEIGNVSG